MKKKFVFALTGLHLFAQVVLADEDLDAYPQKILSVHKQGGGQSQPQIFSAVEIVRKIDPDNGILTIFLDHVAALNWPPMIRIFSVTDKSVFERFKVGEKLKFEFEKDERNEMMIDIK